MIEVIIKSGTTKYEMAELLINKANEHNDCVSACFQGVIIYVYPGSSSDLVLAGWKNEYVNRKNSYDNCDEAEMLELKARQLRVKQQQENMHNVIIKPNNISYIKETRK